MKNSKNFLLIMLCLVACNANAQPKGIWDYPGKQSIWDFPIKPGMEEWRQFQSNEEMVMACQIPEEALSSLSTEYLTDLCLRYPLLADFFAFENTNAGLDKLFSDFNGIRELYRRKDVSKYLTQHYVDKIQSLSFLDGANQDLEKGFFIISISTLEVLLSCIKWQNSEESKKVLQALVAGYEEKHKYSDYFKGTGFQTNFYARSHILLKIQPSFVERLPNKDKSGALYSGMADAQSIHIIDELSYQIIK